MITTKELKRVYGEPDERGGYLVRLKLPYPMRIAWDLKTKVTTTLCHEKVADELLAIFTDIKECYGYDYLKELGIDIYGGCFNYRKMRGGSDWSRHSWGVAVDLYPQMNKLRWSKDSALFAKPEYENMIDIFYEHGFESLGREKNYDWMHFQVKSGTND